MGLWLGLGVLQAVEIAIKLVVPWALPVHSAASSQGKVQLNLSQNTAFTFFRHIRTGL
jgi:hypothetical protein